MFKRITQVYRRPLVRDIIKTTIYGTAGKTVSFFIPFFIAAWFGANRETDAFFFAYGLILFVASIFGPVVQSMIVPHIYEARANNEDIGRFVGTILAVSGAGLLLLSGLFIVVSKPILAIITHFDKETTRLVFQLLIETAPLIPLLAWTGVLAGTLNSYKKFAFPAVSPAFRAGVNLLIIFVFKDVCGVHSVALGYCLGELVRLLMLLSVINRAHLFKLRVSFQVDHKFVKFLKTASYQIVGMAALSLNPLVDKAMASWLEREMSLFYTMRSFFT